LSGWVREHLAEFGAKPMIAMIALSAVLACVATYVTLRKQQSDELARVTR